MLDPQFICSSDKFLRRKISINYLQMWGTYILDMWSLPSSIRNLTLFHSFFWQLGDMSTEKWHGKTLHRVDRIKLAYKWTPKFSSTIYEKPSICWIHQNKRLTIFISDIMSFCSPLIKSPVNCSQLLTEFLFNLSLSSPCGSEVHSSKVIYI